MMKRIMLAVLAVAILVSCSPSGDGEPRHVNIIAVGFSYEGTDSALPLGPKQDAEAILSHLTYLAEEAGYEVSSLLIEDRNGEMVIVDSGETLTASELCLFLSILPASPKDLNIFYYSGHGGFYDEYGSCILMPFLQENVPPLPILPLSHIGKCLESSGGKSVMIIDACQSGSLSPNDVGSGEVYEEHQDPSGLVDHLASIDASVAISDAFCTSFSVSRDYGDVYVLSACLPTQVSYAGTEEMPNSQFTSAMLKYLGYDVSSKQSGLPAAGEITFSSLYKGVMDILMHDTIEMSEGEEYPIGVVQTPQPTRIPTDLILFRF